MMLPFGRSLAASVLGALQLATVLGASPASIAGQCAGDNNATSSSSSSALKSGLAVVGDYDGQYRPQIHFSPPKNFMNDPNGLFRDAAGIWHLYYQWNPTQTVAGNQHWGHATSRDLYHWINQPIAIYTPRENVSVFSGSAVVDKDNTSGFFPGQNNGVVAIYTLNEQYSDGGAGPQTQAISYSRDGGYHFTAYERNPVIPSNSSQFRDPKVIWYKDHWVMVLAYAQEFVIGIFTSPNLIDWTHASNFSSHGLLGLQFECPNLVRMPYYDGQGQKVDEDMWLLLVSINPGAPLGGSTTQYFPGHFNGTHFKPVDSVARLTDFAKDNYAGQFFYGQAEDEDPILIPWASNWQYANTVPTGGENWRSAMGLPRRSYLTKAERIGWAFVNTPYNLSPVMGEALLAERSLKNATAMVDFSTVASKAVYWEVHVTGIPRDGIPSTATFNFTFGSPVTGEHIRGGYYFDGDTAFFLDRGGARGFDNVFFTDKFSTNSLARRDGTWSMSGVLDRSMIEVFINGGVDYGTSTFFATEPLTLMTLSSADLPGEMEVTVRVNALRSAWAEMASEDGLVYGNRSVGGTGTV